MHPATNAKKSQQKLCTTLLAGGFVVVLGLAANKASAIAPIGDDASLFVTGVATVAYNDNIFLSSSDAKSSGVYDLVPGLSYEYGMTGALTKGFVRVSEDFQEFSSYSSINNQLFNGEFSNTYEDAMSKIDFDASMHQLDQPEYGIQSGQFLVDRNVYHIAATGEQKLDASSSIGAGIIFDDTDYRTPGYTDLKTTAIPVNYYLAVDPKLDFSFGGRVRFNTLEGGDDSTDIYVDIGARGEFTPNLTGEVDVGYNHQEIDVGNGTSGIGADASLTYAYSPKTNIIAGLTDDFGYDAFGDPYRYISGSLGFNSAIDEQWAIDATGTYGYYSYLTENRQDNFFTVQAGISYVVSLNFKVRAGYTLYNNDSTVNVAGFNNDIFSITGTLRF